MNEDIEKTQPNADASRVPLDCIVRIGSWYWHEKTKQRLQVMEHVNIGEGWMCYTASTPPRIVHADEDELSEIPGEDLP